MTTAWVCLCVTLQELPFFACKSQKNEHFFTYVFVTFYPHFPHVSNEKGSPGKSGHFFYFSFPSKTTFFPLRGLPPHPSWAPGTQSVMLRTPLNVPVRTISWPNDPIIGLWSRRLALGFGLVMMMTVPKMFLTRECWTGMLLLSILVMQVTSM